MAMKVHALFRLTQYGCGRADLLFARGVRPSLFCANCNKAFLSTSQAPKGLSRLANAMTNRKLEYSERKQLKIPVELMYDIVEDVSRYSEFVPWCKRSVVLSVKGEVKKAKLEVGFGKITEKYNSTVTCVKPHLVKAVCTDGLLFNSLLCTWRFSPGRVKDACVIDFHVAFEFRSLLYSQLANMVFNEIVKTMVSAFEKRARRLQAETKKRELDIIKQSMV